MIPRWLVADIAVVLITTHIVLGCWWVANTPARQAARNTGEGL